MKEFRIPVIVLSYLLLFTLFAALLSGTKCYAQTHGQDMEFSGKDLFMIQRCSRCHTLGRGVFVGPDLINVKDKYSRERTIDWIMNPQNIYSKVNKMPVNEGFPPMPNLQVNRENAEKITDYIFNFKKTSNAKSGTITGVVTNGSEDNKKMNGVEVYLRAYMGEKETDNKKISTDKTGEFIFNNLRWDRSYEITIFYEGAAYATDKMVFPPNEDNINLELPVYNPTASDENIDIKQYHMVISTDGETISVAEVIDINNKGNKIFIGTKNELENIDKQTFVINLATKAGNVNLMQGIEKNNIEIKDNKIIDSTSISPGFRRIVITYEIPLSSRNTVIIKKPYFDVDNMLVLINAPKLDTKIEGLSRGENLQFSGITYSKWQGTGIKKGEEIKISIRKSFLSTINYQRFIPVIIFIFFMVVALVYNYRYRDRHS